MHGVPKTLEYIVYISIFKTEEGVTVSITSRRPRICCMLSLVQLSNCVSVGTCKQ